MKSGQLSEKVSWSLMARTGLQMMFHSKLKLLGTLLGVVFAVILSNQQLGTFLGLLQKNTMFIDNAKADIWIVPPGTEAFEPGKRMPISVLLSAQVQPGVAVAQPILVGAVSVTLPSGKGEAVTLVGSKWPQFLGGPWNLVNGDASVLTLPDTMIFEDSQRTKFGGLNVGALREVNGRSVRAGGFTWGLLPFGPSFGFSEFNFARELLQAPNDQVNFVLVQVNPGVSSEEMRNQLAKVLPDQLVMTKAEYKASAIKYVLVRTAIGITFGSTTLFGLIIGFVIVCLSMFSGVIDNIREFGTLKALGATTFDLAKLLFTQSVAYGTIGTSMGLVFVTLIAGAARSPNLAMNLPPVLTLSTAVIMVLLCLFASGLSLWRLKNLEPGMVFR
jgi:putative ABC transport system permease protein